MSRRLQIAALLSVGLHVLVLAGSWLFVRHGGVVLQPVDKQAAIELVMVEQKGAGQTEGQAPAPPTAPKEQPPAEQPQPTTEAAQPHEPSPAVPPMPTEPSEPLPVPPPVPPTPAVTVAQAAPAAAPAPAPARLEMAIAPPPPVFNLGGTDSDSNAIAEGKNIIPAEPDKKYRNRPPPYPEEAVLRGEQGAVIVVVHVSPLGLPDSAEVVESSGHASLDRAALRAVQSWRFVPAVRDGQPVAFDMPMRFVFAFN